MPTCLLLQATSARTTCSVQRWCNSQHAHNLDRHQMKALHSYVSPAVQNMLRLPNPCQTASLSVLAVCWQCAAPSSAQVTQALGGSCLRPSPCLLLLVQGQGPQVPQPGALQEPLPQQGQGRLSPPPRRPWPWLPPLCGWLQLQAEREGGRLAGGMAG